MDFYKENKKWVLVLASVIVIVILIAVFGNTFSDGNLNDKKEIPIIDSISAYHSYESGLHNYRGSLTLPNPCYILSVDAVVRESFPEDVTIRFTVQEEKGDKVCAQVLTEKGFRIIFQASKEAKVQAVINDVPVQFNIEKETITK
ncbi:hypothetical protein KJ991_01115 [Patescibacteria group bacterium]|nr:hypothetical protein [Patescibacteria group bacterium]MBU4057541.1 hypothetical protein [Patescibacteria group bacterium]MBU4115904.1 hypothetical protein [Patescibacteria group bacterium]